MIQKEKTDIKSHVTDLTWQPGTQRGLCRSQVPASFHLHTNKPDHLDCLRTLPNVRD